MTAIKIILSIIVSILLIALGVTVFLGPDSLRQCGESPTDAGECIKAGAIVVVSGGDTVARTDEAIKLYKAGWSDTVIFSGAAADKTGPSNAQTMSDYAQSKGVPYEAVLTEELSETTDQNATNTMKIVRERNFESIILVTSGYHARRATMEFERNGAGVDVRSHPVPDDKDWGRWWWTTPWGWRLAGSEIIKVLITSTGGVDRT